MELDPDYPDAYLARCVARNRLNILDGQEADANRLAEISRAGDRALSLGLNLTRSGLSGAEPPIGVTSENANLRAMIANQLLRAGRADEALAMLDLVVAAAPDHLSARYDRACILLGQRRNEGLYECAALAAHERFDELVSSHPGAIRILHQLAYHRLRQGDPTEALSLARRGLTLALKSRRPGEPEAPIVAESRFALARALVQDSPSDLVAAHEAAELLDAAGQADPVWVRDKFPRDRFFDPSRAAIVARMEDLRRSRAGAKKDSAAVPR